MTTRKFWTPGHIATLLGVTRVAVTDWIKQGKLSAFLMKGRRSSKPNSRRYMVRIEDLCRFIQANSLPTMRPLNGTLIYSILLVHGDSPPWFKEVYEKLSRHRWLLADNLFDAGQFYREFLPDLVIVTMAAPSLALRLQNTPSKLLGVGVGNLLPKEVPCVPADALAVIGAIQSILPEAVQECSQKN